MLFGFCVTNAADIVFKYRQTVTRSFQHLQGDYYIAPAFMVSVFALSLSLSLNQKTCLLWHWKGEFE